MESCPICGKSLDNHYNMVKIINGEKKWVGVCPRAYSYKEVVEKGAENVPNTLGTQYIYPIVVDWI